MKNWTLSIFVFLILLSCATTKTRDINLFPPLSAKDNEQKGLYQSRNLSITGLNLSEDMSSLSTKNDEIFLFIYEYSDTNKLTSPLVTSKLVFNKKNLKQNVSIPNKENLLLFVIEEDSFSTTIQIEPVVRVYFKEIMKADGYEEIRKYLGEDDLLGTKIITSTTSAFTISGMCSLDKYEYSFEIK
ncbi:MAG: hypothetical protein ABF242_07660 [Flavobacteriales bacterium]